MALIVNAGPTLADDPALKLRATVIGAGAPAAPLTIELFRWSTDAERAPLVAALVAPPPSPAPSAPVPLAGGRAGRAGRGGRGAAPPPSPLARLTAAIKAAPTVGFIWGEGPTGYSIKYAWRSSYPNALDRIVLATDRRLGANATSWPPAGTIRLDESSSSAVSSGRPGDPTLVKAGADAEFTVLELRIDSKGLGEARSSLTSAVVVDVLGNTLALDKYAEAPVLLKVTR
jgi:hypothetical protein